MRAGIILQATTQQTSTKRVEVVQADLPGSIQEHLLKAYPEGVFQEAFKLVNETGKVVGYEVKVAKEEKILRIGYNDENVPIRIEEQ